MSTPQFPYHQLDNENAQQVRWWKMLAGLAHSVALVVLASGPLGVSVGFALQYDLLTPYSIALGMSQTTSSLVWLCGPVTGMIVQPLVGKLSDRWNMRIPFVAIGWVLLVVASLLVFLAVDLGHMLGDVGSSHHFALGLFVLGFWLLDASNNTLYVLFRALCADEGSANFVFSAQQSWCAFGLVLGYLFGQVDWANTSVGEHVDRWIGSDFCPLECAQSHTNCPEAYVAGCFDLRMAFLLNILCCTVSVVASTAARWLLHRGDEASQQPRANNAAQPRLSYRAASSTDLESSQAKPATSTDSQNESRPLVRGSRPGMSYRLIYVCTLLSWLGWFSIQMYQSHYVAVEVLGGSDGGRKYEKALHWASGGLMASAVLSWASAILLPFLLRVITRETVWMCSNALLALVLMVSPAVRGKAGSLAWQASFGPMYSVTQSVPYSMLADLADASSEAWANAKR